jgi:hypothetical protein
MLGEKTAYQEKYLSVLLSNRRLHVLGCMIIELKVIRDQVWVGSQRASGKSCGCLNSLGLDSLYIYFVFKQLRPPISFPRAEELTKMAVRLGERILFPFY